MKARILSLAAVVLLSVVSLYASNPKTKVYSNVINGTKEYTIVDSETSKALRRSVCNYDSKGYLQEREYFKWDDTKGWMSTQKYNYEYYDNKLATIVYTEWDNEQAEWSNMSQHFIHVYDTKGELLAVEKFEVTKDLMANK